MPELDTLTKRAVANALFPKLRARAWRRHLQTRDLANTGDHIPQRSTVSGHYTHPARALDHEVITDERFIRAAIWSEEWPGARNLLVHLDYGAYELALGTYTPAAFTEALAAARCRKPFEIDRNRHGQLKLRRNKTDPAVTAQLAQTLEAIAAAARVVEVPDHQVDDALFSDEDIDLSVLEAMLGVGIS